MRVLAAGACAATILFVAGIAQAQTRPLEKDFEQICVSMSDVDDALMRSRAAGYVTAPQELRSRAGVPREAVVLLRTAEAQVTMIILLRQRLPGVGPFRRAMVAEVCTVNTMEAQPDVDQRLETLLGVGEIQKVVRLGNRYVYAQRSGGREAVKATREVMDALAGEGALRIAGSSRNGGAGMMLMAPRPEVKPAK